MKIPHINQMNRDHDNVQSRFMERESEMKYVHIYINIYII